MASNWLAVPAYVYQVLWPSRDAVTVLAALSAHAPPLVCADTVTVTEPVAWSAA